MDPPTQPPTHSHTHHTHARASISSLVDKQSKGGLDRYAGCQHNRSTRRLMSQLARLAGWLAGRAGGALADVLEAYFTVASHPLIGLGFIRLLSLTLATDWRTNKRRLRSWYSETSKPNPKPCIRSSLFPNVGSFFSSLPLRAKSRTCFFGCSILLMGARAGSEAIGGRVCCVCVGGDPLIYGSNPPFNELIHVYRNQ